MVDIECAGVRWSADDSRIGAHDRELRVLASWISVPCGSGCCDPVRSECECTESWPLGCYLLDGGCYQSRCTCWIGRVRRSVSVCTHCSVRVWR